MTKYVNDCTNHFWKILPTHNNGGVLIKCVCACMTKSVNDCMITNSKNTHLRWITNTHLHWVHKLRGSMDTQKVSERKDVVRYVVTSCPQAVEEFFRSRLCGSLIFLNREFIFLCESLLLSGTVTNSEVQLSAAANSLKTLWRIQASVKTEELW
jgi:hypothetical protein